MLKPTDHTLPLRRAIIMKLLATSAVTDLLGTRFYGMRTPDSPEWPFGRYGAPDTRPYEATGLGGSDSDITLHVFARGPDEGPCATIADTIVDALSDDMLPLEGGVGLVSLDWQGTQIIEDGGESTDYHAIIRFSVITTE